MKSLNLVDLRRKALRDPTLSAQAARLVALLVEWVYVQEHLQPDEAWPMPWSQVARWTGAQDEHTIYRWFEEASKYVRQGAVRGCPPTRHYFLCPDTGTSTRIKTGTSTRIETGTHARTDSGTGTRNPISNPFRKEKESQMESNGAQGAKEEGKEFNGSLRSKEEGEARVSALRANAETTADAVVLKNLFSGMKAAAGVNGAKAGRGKGGEASNEARAGGVPAKATPPVTARRLPKSWRWERL